MSFYFDDDNDDNAFSQNFRTPTQKQVTFSQSSVFPLSQLSSHQTSPEKKHSQPFSPIQQSQQSWQSSMITPSRGKNSNSNSNSNNQNVPENTFVCQNCGAVDDYYHDDAAGGLATCSHCFTQSQSFEALQEELDYEDTQGLAARNRDGTLKTVHRHDRRSRSGTNADGSNRTGRPPVPLADCDQTQKPPSLEACLKGLQAVLQNSCKIMCFELMAITITIPTEELQSNTADSNTVGSDESDHDSAILRNNATNHKVSNVHKKELYRQVSKALKVLWKAYLLSWKEGADFYSSLYPQIRFALRDKFLDGNYLKILYRTLAAKAEEKVTQQVRKEVEEEESPSEEDDDSDSDSDSDSDPDSEDDSCSRRKSKKIKVEHDQSDNRNVNEGMDSLFDLFDRDGGGTEKIKSENDSDGNDDDNDNDNDNDSVVSKENVPVPDLVFSNDSKMPFRPYRGRSRRRPWDRNNAWVDNDISDSRNYDNKHEGNNDTNKSHDDAADDNSTCASDLSVFDAAEIKNKDFSSKKRKRMIQKEFAYARSTNTYAKMIYFHNKLMNQTSKSRKIHKVGRKEAALLLVPSMKLVLGMLLVVASPHGVTEGKIIEWVENGSLPIMHAFACLLSNTQQETLAMAASFFSLSLAPSVSNLRQIVKQVHVACGYRAPKVKLVSLQPPPPPSQRGRKRALERILNTRSMSAPGRLVCPSTVPLILGLLVSELGLSQKVLNYSLALMGLPVSRQTLKAKTRDANEGVTLPRDRAILGNNAYHDGVRRPWDSDDIPVFDLTKPSERLRKRKYLLKINQRRCRARKRKNLGLSLQTKKRKNEYKANDQKDGDIKVNNQKALDNNDQDIPADWLPPPLLGARPDKLGEVDQILAVMIIACKLIPGWEMNHQYVFSRGLVLGKETKNTDNTNVIAEDETISDFGTSGGGSTVGHFQATDRFVPWNQEQFRFIRNGKTELEYLEFLKETIFRGSDYALPKFVESLNENFSPHSDRNAAREEDSVEEEEMDKNHSSDSDEVKEDNRHENDNAVVVPNELFLGWKKNPRLDKRKPSKWNPELGMPYRLTTISSTKGLRTPGGPLGPLIEYMAYKTGTCHERILKHLIKFDEEMASKGKSQTNFISFKDLCYNHAQDVKWKSIRAEVLASFNGYKKLDSKYEAALANEMMRSRLKNEQENSSKLPQRISSSKHKQNRKTIPIYEDDEDEVNDYDSLEESGSNDSEKDDNEESDDDENNNKNSLSDYEKLRLEKIKRNEDRLKELGLSRTNDIFAASGNKTKNKQKAKIKKGLQISPKLPRRHSPRKRNSGVDYKEDSDINEESGPNESKEDDLKTTRMA